MSPEIFQQLGSRTLLSKEVEGKIQNAIQEKKFAPGEKLPTELELCESFGVSRTVMREALRMLSARGLISIQKGKGIYVRDFSVSDLADPIKLYLTLNYDGNHVLDVVEARKAIEPSVAALAARNRTEKDLAKLFANLRELESYNGNYEKLAVLDQDFHILIANASGNQIVPLLMEPIHRLMPQIKSSVYETIEDAKTSAVEYHGKLLKCIENHDEAGARSVMETHLQIAELHARIMLQRKGHEPGSPVSHPAKTAGRP